MSGGEVRAGERCPECQAPLVRSEPRFSAWCRGCDWNVDPAEQRRKRPGRVARFRQRIEDRLAESLYNGLAGGPDVRTGGRLTEMSAFAIAVVVHLFTVSLLVLAGWIASMAWRNPIAWVAILLLPAIALLMRPRFGRLDDDTVLISRKSAPTLHALVDRMRAEVGAPRLAAIGIDTDFNARATAVGLRRRKVLVIGLPRACCSPHSS
ncbi:M48 family metallopeptidase [Flindersiella endophytica]